MLEGSTALHPPFGGRETRMNINWHNPALYSSLALLAGIAALAAIIIEVRARKLGWWKRARPLDGLLRDRPRPMKRFALLAVVALPITGLAEDSWTFTLYALLMGLVAATVTLRLGLLTWTVSLVVQFLLTRLPITLDTDAWYYESSLLTLLLIGGLAAYGCVTAVQAKPHRAAANTLAT